jgi:RimJ/RimL family protein N-acetyltransferase
MYGPRAARRGVKKDLLQERSADYARNRSVGLSKVKSLYGEIVKDLSPAVRPRRETLEGRVVLIQPLDSLVHGDALYEGTHADHREELWRYLPEGPFPDRSTFGTYLKRASVSEDPLFFAIVDKSSGVASGMAAYLRIEPIHKVIEVGHILFTPKLQRTVAATEAMFLMAQHVFDLGYRRYEWKCNALNESSQRAARRLGFTFEGVFRQHMIVKGRNRDTAWFSMLDSEWPARKARFEQWLDAKNFDENGVQKLSLSAING